MEVAAPHFPADPKLVKAAVEAMVDALTQDARMCVDQPSRTLRSSLLAESRDESDAAATRCKAIRSDIAEHFAKTLASRESKLSHLVKQDIHGHSENHSVVRAEVRRNAGRYITDNVFTIGSAGECDIQIYGDSTVQPLQCIVLALAGGLVVVDAWTDGKACATWPRSIYGQLQQSVFVLDKGERVVLRLGDRTTITLCQMAELHLPEAKADVKRDRLIWSRNALTNESEQSTTMQSSTEGTSRSLSFSRSRSPRCRYTSPMSAF